MVVMFRIYGKGQFERVYRGVMRLPKESVAAAFEVSEKTAKWIRKSARIRVRKWQRTLAESIIVRKARRAWIVEARSRYALFQEVGFRRHPVHLSMPTFSGDTTIRDWLLSKYPHVLFKKPGIEREFIYVGGLKTSYRPYIRPAIRKGLEKMRIDIEREIRNAIIRSFR